MSQQGNKPFKANNVLRPVIPRSQIYKAWLEFVKPFYMLTDREIEVAASFLQQREILRKVILDETILIRTLHDEETAKAIRGRCTGMSGPYFQIVKSKLKAKKFFNAEGDIEPLLIPKVEEGENTFKLLFLIKMTDDVPGDT